MRSERNKRIAKNTLVLYARQLLILFVNLYTVRVILNVLGVEDYGIFNVVAGLVAVSSFLPASLASATQRYFSFALGADDKSNLFKVFSVNMFLYAGIAIGTFAILETLGLWFLSTHLELPVARLVAAEHLFHLSVLTFIASIFTSPFVAIVIAHEDMGIYGIVSILEVFLKLGSVFMLQWIDIDKLSLYGLLLLLIAIANTLVYAVVCFRRYAECQFRTNYWDVALMRDIASFTGWTMFGQFTTVIRTHAITILLNQLYGPALVAARSIAVNVANTTNIFANNFNTGLYPPIIKSYAAGNSEDMVSLVTNGSKITFFLMWVFALPLIVEMDSILSFWLKSVPGYAVEFTQLALIESLIFSLGLPIATAARAPGKMKWYELILGSLQIGIFLLAWAVLSFGAPPYSVFIIAIVMNIVIFLVRLLLVKHLINFPILPYLQQVAVPLLAVVSCSALPVMIMKLLLPDTLATSVLIIFVSCTLSVVAMYFIGLNKVWRRKATDLLVLKLNMRRNK